MSAAPALAAIIYFTVGFLVKSHKISKVEQLLTTVLKSGKISKVEFGLKSFWITLLDNFFNVTYLCG